MEQEKAQEIVTLYQDWLTAWNNRNAAEMSTLFAEQGNLIGFDGSQISGRKELEETLSTIFAHHATASYVALIREIRFFSPDTAWLKADAGMVPSGGTDINPAFNAVQTMIAINVDGKWLVSILQNTPATFYAAPELKDKLTDELRQILADNN